MLRQRRRNIQCLLCPHTTSSPQLRFCYRSERPESGLRPQHRAPGRRSALGRECHQQWLLSLLNNSAKLLQLGSAFRSNKSYLPRLVTKVGYCHELTSPNTLSGVTDQHTKEDLRGEDNDIDHDLAIPGLYAPELTCANLFDCWFMRGTPFDLRLWVSLSPALLTHHSPEAADFLLAEVLRNKILVHLGLCEQRLIDVLLDFVAFTAAD